MPTKHVDKLIEAYLDNQLSPLKYERVDAHLRECPLCARLLFDTQRLRKELGPLMRAALGKPNPPPMLRHKVKRAVQNHQDGRRFGLNLSAPIRILNAAGNVAIIAILAFGVLVVIRGQIPGVGLLSEVTPLSSSSSGQNEASKQVALPTPTAIAALSSVPLKEISPQGPLVHQSLGDTLLPVPPAAVGNETEKAVPETSFAFDKPEKSLQPLKTYNSSKRSVVKRSAEIKPPGGTIAFPLYDSTPGIDAYRVYFINPDGSHLRQYPLSDVSEPALHPDQNQYALSLRTWNEATHPRTILTSNFSGDRRKPVTHFWEDAQPDWSPTENRIIFASQRESDRRWRLYTAWGDAAFEKNLRREGQSPTFAPDGRRFAFESCDERGNHCGLWLSTLDNTEYGSKPFLEDRLAKSPDWSPKNEEIAYMANPDGNWDLYAVKSDGSDVRRLTNDPAIDGLPAWSPDGEWLAFVSDRGSGWGLWLLHLESGQTRHVTPFENGSLAPDDRRPYNEHSKRHWWDEQLSWGR